MSTNPVPFEALSKQVSDQQLRSARSLFSKNILKLLRDKCLSVSILAQDAEIDLKLLSEILEGNVRPSKYVIEKLSNSLVLNTSYKTLVTWCLLDDYIAYTDKKALVS